MIFPRAADFPKCNLYLRDEMPKVVRVPRIANAMRELGRLDGALFDRAVKPGTQPTLLLFDRPMPSDSILGERWMIPRDKSGRMVLNVSLFEDFEAQSGDLLMGTAHVSARPGSPGAREFSGRFDRRGIIETMAGSAPRPGSGTRSIGLYREKALFRFGACILGALVDWGLWTQEGREDKEAATRFAVHAYRSFDVF